MPVYGSHQIKISTKPVWPSTPLPFVGAVIVSVAIWTLIAFACVQLGALLPWGFLR